MWTSGVVAEIAMPHDAAARLSDFSYQREEGRWVLKSQVSLDGPHARGRGDQGIISGTVFEEYLHSTRPLEADSEGRFRLGPVHPVKDTRWGRFWVTKHSVAAAQRFDTADFTFRVLGKALGIEIHVLTIDVQKMAKDTKGHWLGAITGRRGHVQSATLYGDDIEDDSDMGQAYVSSQKSQIGFWTDYFGGRTKVKATRDGSVTVYGDLTEDRPTYLAFIKDVVLPYKI